MAGWSQQRLNLSALFPHLVLNIHRPQTWVLSNYYPNHPWMVLYIYIYLQLLDFYVFFNGFSCRSIYQSHGSYGLYHSPLKTRRSRFLGCQVTTLGEAKGGGAFNQTVIAETTWVFWGWNWWNGKIRKKRVGRFFEDLRLLRYDVWWWWWWSWCWWWWWWWFDHNILDNKHRRNFIFSKSDSLSHMNLVSQKESNAYHGKVKRPMPSDSTVII